MQQFKMRCTEIVTREYETTIMAATIVDAEDILEEDYNNPEKRREMFEKAVPVATLEIYQIDKEGNAIDPSPAQIG